MKFTELPDYSELTILAGAGISADSGIPIAYNLADKLIDALITPKWANEEIKLLCKSNRDDMKSKYDFIRFENLLSWISDVFDRNLGFFEFLDYYTNPNLAHYILGHAASKGSLIITPNFDDLLERAALQFFKQVNTINAHTCDIEAIDEILKMPGNIIKFHGTRNLYVNGKIESEDFPLHSTIESIISTNPGLSLNEEAFSVLKKAIDGKTLIIVGYSASDTMDIVPSLFECVPKKAIWIQHSDSEIHQNEPDDDEISDYPWAELLETWKLNGTDVVCYLGPTTEVLSSLDLSFLYDQKYDNTYESDDWIGAIKSWAEKVRHNDITGLGLASLLFMDMERRESEWQALNESVANADIKHRWTTARKKYLIAQYTYFEENANRELVGEQIRDAENEAIAMNEIMNDEKTQTWRIAAMIKIIEKKYTKALEFTNNAIENISQNTELHLCEQYARQIILKLHLKYDIELAGEIEKLKKLEINHPSTRMGSILISYLELVNGDISKEEFSKILSQKRLGEDERFEFRIITNIPTNIPIPKKS